MALNYLQGMAGRFGRGANTLGTMEDPRARFAQQLQVEGADTSPAFLGTGLSRLGKALVGALMMKRSMADQSDATKWLASKMPDRTRPPTDPEVFKASPELDALQQLSQPGFIGPPEAKLAPDTDDVLMGKTEVDEFGDPTGIPKTLEQLNFLNYMQEQHKDFPEQTEFTNPYTGRTDTATAEDFAKAGLPGEIDEGSRLFVEQMEQARQASMKPRPVDYAQELATGMEAYRADPTHQISDPYTRMEWLQESYRNDPELKNNWFANRLIQNLMFNEIARGDEDRIWKREQEAKIKAAERPMTPKQYEQAVGVKEAGRDAPTSQMKNFEKAKNDPAFATYLDTYKKAGGRISAAIQNYEHLQTLLKIADPAERKTAVDNWWNTLGTAKHVDTGPEIQVMTRGAPTIPAAKIKKGLTPSQEPGHVRDVERNKYIGKQMGEAQLNYPDLVIDTEYRVELLDKALNHPGLPGVVGLPSVAGITHAPGTSEANFRVLMKQIEGANFLQAFQGLKGGGHITEIEGEQAKQSLARMSASQDETEFKVALLELQALLRRGLMKAGIRSRGGITPGGDVPSVNNRRKGDDPMDLGL